MRRARSAGWGSFVALTFIVLLSRPIDARRDEAPKRIDAKDSCVSGKCHSTLTQSRHMHWEDFGERDQCEKCHVASDDSHRFATDVDAEACHECHSSTAKAIDDSEFPHAAAEDECIDCHDPHGSDFPRLLVAEGRALCRTCHRDVVEGAESAEVDHGPTVSGKECGHCHEPHASTEEGLLRRPLRTLCLGCHSERVDSGGTQLENIGRKLSRNSLWHDPIGVEGCARCHQAHGGANFRILRAAYPPRFYSAFATDAYALCFECHEEKSMTVRYTRSFTKFRDGNRNLHYLHVNRKRRGRTCRACHDVHAARSPFLVRDGVPYGEKWWMRIEFERTRTGGSCRTGCHGRNEYDRDAADSHR